MAGVLTPAQRDKIGSVKKLFREESEFSSIVIVRTQQTVELTPPSPYGTGTVTYLDKLFIGRLIHLNNKWERIESAGNVTEAVYKLIIDIANKDEFDSTKDIYINHSFSSVPVAVPAVVDNASVVSKVDYLGDTNYTNYTSDGSVSGSRLKVLGERELYPNTWEAIFFLKKADD